VPSLGLLLRYTKSGSEIQWFEVPGFNMMHALNAWDDDDDTVVLVRIMLMAPNVLSIKHALEREELVQSSIELVRIYLQTGKVSRTLLAANNLEFVVINLGYVGKKNRCGYSASATPCPTSLEWQRSTFLSSYRRLRGGQAGVRSHLLRWASHSLCRRMTMGRERRTMGTSSRTCTKISGDWGV
ncbi:hypothetical protein J5N97_028230, partial [Dioscorea zingiberensis]